ncbi:hypothetical protein N7462_003645 [Penicillium macrosclerotiorum]|uniref:uncharacterized protein n=1 Tax=Penicillium macrosclerotiorum TaxID=303699 RepID=UPI00254732AF|nr:uncharacterized protein N7462_003645 [Penicillium macrosclerotiorum]KAJ5689253.1 hypothetical protein N7462_003645 [Penicillium macrosclerotiorum]
MASSIVWSLLGVLLVLYILRRKTDNGLTKVPVVKYIYFLPNIFNRLIFYPKAKQMIYKGYAQYKDTPFRMLTGDGEVVVLPIKYVDELKHRPPSSISSLDAQFENALGEYTNIIIHSYLPSMTVRKRLTPSLGRVIPWVIDELRYAFESALPECEDRWVSAMPHQVFVRLIARATSRVVAGDSLRRNEEWLNTASSYSVNVGVTILLLRPFPKFLRPFVALFLPSVRQMKQQLRFVKDLFIPMINERRAAEAAATSDYIKPDDFLQWMMDMAEDEQDMDPEALAHHMLILMSLAVVHTSSIAMCHALYDLICMPEYQEPLRVEIRKTLSSGWNNATKSSFDSQRRLDSFLRESQRFGPPGEFHSVSFHRIVKEPFTLSDGLFLPEGTHICFPSGPISKDPNFIPNPNVFDGFRWCQDPADRDILTIPNTISNGNLKENQKRNDLVPAPSTSTSFISISPSNMHFGFGRQACPGRFFASCTIKAIFSRIIMDYEFKFEEERGNWRPANIGIGEHIFPNTSTPVLFRKRPMEL